MRTAITLAMTALLLLGGCSTRAHRKWEKGTHWALVKVELEESLLHHKGDLPVFSPPSADDFGRVPLAEGSLGVAEEGRVVCRVVFIEQAPRGSYRYSAVAFDGLFGDNPNRIVPVRPPPKHVPLGTTTVLHVRQLANGYLRVQGATADDLLPYVYYFAPPPARVRPVSLPTLSR